MAQRIFQSFRRLPAQLTSMRKKHDNIEVVGSHYKINVCSNIGFPSKPSSLAYDQALNIFALATRDGLIYVYGKPGVVYSGSHKDSSEIIKVVFLTGTGKLLTLSDTDDIYMWEIDSSNGVHPCLRNIGSLIGVSSALEPKHLGVEQPSSTDDDPESVSHVTALIVAASGTVIFVGTDQGSVASIRRNMQVKRGVAQDEGTMWILPTQDEVITPQRVLQSIPPEKRGRLRLDAVVVLSERPGYPGHLLIGYSSGLCVLFDLHADRVLCLLPCQYELEAVAWCGGSGRPIRGASANPTATPPHLGTRLLTAYANGSLGVWQVPLFTAAAAASGPPTDPSMQTLHMMESPSMPYGPFPCKLIDKVFWLPSHKGGITVFSGGMPRSTYGNRHTVSILRGSNLDQAAAANLAAALRADAGGEDSLLDDDEEELDGEGEEFDDGDQTGLLASGLVPGAPVHVFDSDAPEHVCLDLSSPLVDVCPVGPAGGPAAGLLILCEEEMVAVDLLTPGWPLFSLPYLSCLHTASLTAYGLFTQVNPAFLARLEAVSSTCDRGDAFGLAASPGEAGNASAKPRLSSRPWPIQGGQCVPAAGTGSPVRSASFDPARSLVTSNDLLITGHENGAVAFWRLGPGGCSRNVFTLYTGSLFEGDFGPDVSGDPTRATEEEADPWPPFRRASLFDPFMDDVRAAIKAIRLVDNTLVLGGAAGQVSVWQFSDSKPAMAKLDLPITPEIPGFRWKGNAPLTLRPSMHQRCPGASLFPVGLALSQPPSPVTSIAVCELRDTLDKSALNQPIGVLVAVGSPHGFAVLHLSTPTGTAARSMEAGGGGGGGEGVGCHLLLHHSTIPANSEALEEAAVGEGWARRRTRELKNSLRDSFRRLKRMKSTRSSMSTASTPATAASPPAQSHSPVVRLNYSARVGLRRSVTQPTSSSRRTPQYRGDPLQEALSRSRGNAATAAGWSDDQADAPMPTGGEREIRDRPTETANTALIRCLAFGPPLHHRVRAPTATTPHLLGSFFAGTSGGAALVYALFADSARRPHKLALRHATEMQLQHRAPIINIRLIDTKTHCSLLPTTVYPASYSTAGSHHLPPPHMMVISEEQVRLFALPSISLRQKARITAKDGFRIKTGNIIAFGQASNDSRAFSGTGSLLRGVGIFGPEFSCVFTNNGGQAVVLSVPHLRRRDTIPLMGPGDLLEMNSVMFAEAGSCDRGVVVAPSLGLYQTAPGQLAMFDVVLAGQKSSVLGNAYRAVHRVKPTVTSTGTPVHTPENRSPIKMQAPTPSPRLQQRLAKTRATVNLGNTPSTSLASSGVVSGSSPISGQSRPLPNGY